MSDAGNSFRLAIGVFYEPLRLEDAIADLYTDGVQAPHMCLAGARQAIDGLALPASSGGTAHLTGQLRPLPLADDLQLVATDGHLLHALLEHTRPDQQSPALAHSWLLPDLFAGLTDHLRAGAVALLVSAPDIGVQRRNSRILLRHSAHTVQTHEFASRQGGAR